MIIPNLYLFIFFVAVMVVTEYRLLKCAIAMTAKIEPARARWYRIVSPFVTNGTFPLDPLNVTNVSPVKTKYGRLKRWFVLHSYRTTMVPEEFPLVTFAFFLAVGGFFLKIHLIPLAVAMAALAFSLIAVYLAPRAFADRAVFVIRTQEEGRNLLKTVTQQGWQPDKYKHVLNLWVKDKEIVVQIPRELIAELKDFYIF